MAERTEDRRTRRSKRLLKQGLAELMQEKPFHSITVRDITDRMDLNRGTFYLHYADTYELLQKLEEDSLADVQSMIDEHTPEVNAGTLRPVFEPILDYIAENKAICRALFVNNSTSNFMDKVHRLIYENGVALLHACYDLVPNDRMDYLLSFLTYGLIGLIKRWFDTDMAMSKGEVVQIADELVKASTEQLLR